MTEAERKLLIWCAIMRVRERPLEPYEADEIDQLIANVRHPLPKIEWDTPTSGRIVAAAPDLFEALRRLLATVNPGNADEHEDGCRCVIHEARAALARVQP